MPNTVEVYRKLIEGRCLGGYRRVVLEYMMVVYEFVEESKSGGRAP